MSDFVIGMIVVVGLLVGLYVFTQWLNKRRRAKRNEEVWSHKDDWGEGICQWLIDNDIYLETPIKEVLERIDELGPEVAKSLIKRHEGISDRVENTLAHKDDWGDEAVYSILRCRLRLGMTKGMVRLAWGEPDTVDQREISRSGEKYRWVYGVPRQGASYVWFKDDKVTKIKQS